MPTYEYGCQTCGNNFEVIRKISDMRRQEHCPVCAELAPIKVSRGFTHGDEAAWLNDEQTRGALLDDSSINRNESFTRTEYKKVLKEKGIVERA